MIESREGLERPDQNHAPSNYPPTSAITKLQGTGAQKARSPELSDLRSPTTARHAIPSPRSRSELQTQNHLPNGTFSESLTSETSGESTAQAFHPQARRASPSTRDTSVAPDALGPRQNNPVHWGRASTLFLRLTREVRRMSNAGASFENVAR